MVKKLLQNREAEKQLTWARGLNDEVKEMYNFLSDVTNRIKEDIECGGTVSRIPVPASLHYKKNMRDDPAFWMVVNKFTEALAKEDLRVIFTEMAENDINRQGDDDHYIHVDITIKG